MRAARARDVVGPRSGGAPLEAAGVVGEGDVVDGGVQEARPRRILTRGRGGGRAQAGLDEREHGRTAGAAAAARPVAAPAHDEPEHDDRHEQRDRARGCEQAPAPARASEPGAVRLEALAQAQRRVRVRDRARDGLSAQLGQALFFGGRRFHALTQGTLPRAGSIPCATRALARYSREVMVASLVPSARAASA